MKCWYCWLSNMCFQQQIAAFSRGLSGRHVKHRFTAFFIILFYCFFFFKANCSDAAYSPMLQLLAFTPLASPQPFTFLLQRPPWHHFSEHPTPTSSPFNMFPPPLTLHHLSLISFSLSLKIFCGSMPSCWGHGVLCLVAHVMLAFTIPLSGSSVRLLGCSLSVCFLNESVKLLSLPPNCSLKLPCSPRELVFTHARRKALWVCWNRSYREFWWNGSNVRLGALTCQVLWILHTAYVKSHYLRVLFWISLLVYSAVLLHYFYLKWNCKLQVGSAKQEQGQESFLVCLNDSHHREGWILFMCRVRIQP